MKSFIRHVSFVILLCVLLSSVAFPVFADNNLFLAEGSLLYQSALSKFAGDNVIESWKSASPVSVRLFRDAEHSDSINSITEIAPGDKVYYEISTDEGYYIEAFYGAFDYLDDEYFIPYNFFAIEFSSVLSGDFNNDGKVNMKDLYWLTKYTNGAYDTQDRSVSENMSAGDYNRDGEINSSDITGLTKMLAGWGNIHGGVADGFETVIHPRPTGLPEASK